MANSTATSGVVAYFDETTKTVEVYPVGKSSPRLARFDAASVSAARRSMTRRGWTVTATDDYPYGTILNGKPA